MNPLPTAFLEAMRQQLGADEVPEFLRQYELPPCRGLRVNPLKPLPEGCLPPDVMAPVPWAAGGYYLEADSRAGAVPLHEAGGWYLQEPSAMLPAAVLAPQPGERVLDLCAAPGGKSTQMAAALRGQGLLISNEIAPSRAQILSRNVERIGVVNAVVVSAAPQALAQRWPGAFDAVLVDAPCSGEGMFRRHPETRAEWSPEMSAGCAKRQADILDSAAQLVRPGGRLVYATCTFNHGENEDNVDAFLQRHPDFSLCAFQLPGADAPGGMLTCYPHRMRGEGQFAALLRRAGEEPCASLGRHSLPEAGREALRNLAALGGPDRGLHLMGDTLVRLPEEMDLRGLRTLRAGLHIGQVKGNRVEPDHAWAVSATPPPWLRIPLTAEEAVRYLAGEALPAAETCKGWVLPTLSGLVLGIGKVSAGQMKNHYPKGLRRRVERGA